MLYSPGTLRHWPPYRFTPSPLESRIGFSINLINEHFPSVSTLGCTQALSWEWGALKQKIPAQGADS